MYFTLQAGSVFAHTCLMSHSAGHQHLTSIDAHANDGDGFDKTYILQSELEICTST